MIYNLVYEPINKNHGNILLGKYDSKHFDSIKNAEDWAKDKEIKPVSLGAWDDDIDCFRTIKKY